MAIKVLFLYFGLLIFIVSDTFAQAEFIEVECNKTLSLFTFMDAAAEGRASSESYTEFIMDQLSTDPAFMSLVQEYSTLDFDGRMEWKGYPKMRHAGIYAKDLLWMSLAQAESIEDFSQQFYGVIPMHSHAKLIRLLKAGAPYFDRTVWNPQQGNIQTMVSSLSKYKSQIEDLFLKVSKFYGVDWDQNIPFTIQVYPIPLERGMTTAIPKGNALICAFLSEKENEYLGVLGIAIHEMCHIIYAQQTVEKQEEIDAIFNSHPSDFAQKAYAYLDEGLATALGNGWAYKEVHGTLDTSEWYNHEYIDGYAHAMFEDVVSYVNLGKTMDASLVIKSIETFEKTFPNAMRDVMGLLNQVILFVNTESEDKLRGMIDVFIKEFNTRSISMSVPMDEPEGLALLDEKSTSKFFIIDHDKEGAYGLIKKQYPSFNKPPVKASAFVYTFKDVQTGSMVFLIEVQALSQVENLLDQLAKLEFIDPGTLLVYSSESK